MPRFGTRSLLIATAVVALWLSTLTGYAAGSDVRKSILLLILVASGFAAIYASGRRRAFWCGFFVVLLLCGGNNFQRPLHRYLPDFDWMTMSSTQGTVYSYVPTTSARQPVIMPAPTTSVAYSPVATPTPPIWTTVLGTTWILILSLLGGFLAALIYGLSRRSGPQDNL